VQEALHSSSLLLSGTPIQNDLRELWSLFDFVFPKRLGDLPTFESQFADPIKRGGYSNASPMQVQLSYRCALVLRDLINPYLLRRQKKDIKEVSRMPGKTEQVLFCKLSNRQRVMYESYLKSDEVMRILNRREGMQSFRPIIVLRKICNHPELVCGADQASYNSFLKNGYVNEDELDDSSSDEDDFLTGDADSDSFVEYSGKLQVLHKILPLWSSQGHRVLIFSQWKKTLDIIQRFINTKGWKFGRLDGNTNVASRQKLVDSFNNDLSYFGMLLTSKTGGVGLNLTGADRVIIFDPDWNPQSDAQARERAWRFGQKNAVTVYRLISAGTIEEKIYQRQIFKTALTNQVLQDPRQRRMFSQKDLRDLFTLKPDSGDVSKGGDGVTETGEIARGRGVIHPDSHKKDQPDASKDDHDTLESLMKTKGLAGIFDHDYVEKPTKKSISAREMEDQAKKAASDAVKSLMKSAVTRDQSQSFAPTWTGSKETEEPKRFGGVSDDTFRTKSIPRKLRAMKSNNYDNQFGGANAAGIGGMSSNGIISSKSLLSQFRINPENNFGMSKDQTNSPEERSRDQLNITSALLNRIRSYIKLFHSKVGIGPSTDHILNEFQDVADENASEFRSLLKSAAVLKNGKWVLKL